MPSTEILTTLSNSVLTLGISKERFKMGYFSRERENSLIVTVICISNRIYLQEAQQPIH